MWRRNINIGDKVWYVDFDVRKDETQKKFTPEININEVTINWIYNFKDEPTKYLFDFNWNRAATYEELSFSKEAAIKLARKMIREVPIYVANEAIK
jgi:hypothetical protein